MEFDEQRSSHGLLSASDLKREKTAPMLDSSGSEMSEFHMFPASTKYLVWNEFCERFSYYGMKTILALFLLEGQRLTEVQSTEIVHFFMVLCYAIPVLGAIISDSVLGSSLIGIRCCKESSPIKVR